MAFLAILMGFGLLVYLLLGVQVWAMETKTASWETAYITIFLTCVLKLWELTFVAVDEVRVP